MTYGRETLDTAKRDRYCEFGMQNAPESRYPSEHAEGRLRRRRAPVAAQLSRRIYDQLKADISAFRLLPGAALQELELAERYGGSRTPVREALMQLMQEGLVARAGRGLAVISFAPEDVRHLYEVREALERTSVRLVIARASDPELAELSLAVDAQIPVVVRNDVATFNDLDSEFHLLLARMSRNPLLETELRRMHDKVKIVRNRSLNRQQGLERAAADHRRIVDALVRRDVATAEAEMRYHVRSVVALYFGILEPEPNAVLPSALAVTFGRTTGERA